MQKLLEKAILIFLILVWLSHLVQVFIPEVGFDAVWYHLPIVKAILEHKKLVFLPELYQSANPLFSDLIFGLGFFFAGELGSKIVAYLFGLLLIISTYVLSRKFLNKFWSLIVVLIVSTFQVVAWQSASFYVDIAKAFWEISSLIALAKWKDNQQHKWLVISALLFGASLATKLFSLFLLPVFLCLVFIWSKREKFSQILSFTIGSLICSFPFYFFTYLKTDNPFFSFSQHLIKLGEIGGDSSFLSYIWQRTTLLPSLPVQLVIARDYTSFVLILFLPVLFFYIQKLRNNKLLLGMTIFTIWQVFLWWYLPPLSTRYALSGFVIWTIISIWSVAGLSQKNSRFFQPILLSIFLAITINLAPRIFVNIRSFEYLSGSQNKQQYIRQFFDGHIDQHLIKWHQF
ncbi:glycosyltransferase family 39 protein [Patescibacteria group bacterium]|nr:glycosyltransferase family 39 protein [Patescibacteria group bacterium]